MGESLETMCDFYNYQREESRKKRAKNMKQSTEILVKNKINFTSYNNGVHLFVSHNGFEVDFWPTTGKFIFRNSDSKGRGVFKLIKQLNRKEMLCLHRSKQKN